LDLIVDRDQLHSGRDFFAVTAGVVTFRELDEACAPTTGMLQKKRVNRGIAADRCRCSGHSGQHSVFSGAVALKLRQQFLS